MMSKDTLRLTRQAQHLSRAALSKTTGVHPTLVFNVETGAQPMPGRYVGAWADALHLPREAVERYVGGAVKLYGLTAHQRAFVSKLVDLLAWGGEELRGEPLLPTLEPDGAAELDHIARLSDAEVDEELLGRNLEPAEVRALGEEFVTKALMDRLRP